MGLREVPVIQITHLTDLEKRALALAENRIALDAGWDRETWPRNLANWRCCFRKLRSTFQSPGLISPRPT